MAKFDANEISKPDWGIIGGRSEQQLEPDNASLAEPAGSIHV
jgi:hypothetical protein